MTQARKSISDAAADDDSRSSDDLAFLSPTDEIIDDARNGKMFILIDDEGRENEGDLVIPAQMATPDAINFMATHGRGLVCLSLMRERIQQLGLPLLPQTNSSRLETNFTVSIEARDGVTTGISAPDRARTIAVAIDPRSGPDEITTPGHVFPLAARDGGVLVRAGHTEAGVDFSRLAGLNPSSVICEIMNDDGKMARLPDLIKFAQFHGLKIGSIADLIAYRRRNDRIVERLTETIVESKFGGSFKMIVYYNTVEYAEHVALIKGDVAPDRPTLVRMHALSFVTDILGDSSGGGGDLQQAMRLVGETGNGVIVVIREPRATGLSDNLKAQGADQKPSVCDLRDYGVCAQILLDLGVRDMILLSNSERSIIGLDGFGLSVVERRQLS
jgi:3,4-dihydroxy 2-butanone 4-phosphate synthase/GTP cyclohydrolase II